MMRNSNLSASYRIAGNIESEVTLKHLTTQNSYHSPRRHTPWYLHGNATPVFYTRIAWIVWKASRLAQKGVYTDERWIQSSLNTVKALESVGGSFNFENMNAVRKVEPPCVFIGNHMSVLETFILPCLVRPYLDVTFVVKESLIAYPFFKHVMRSRNPIIVGRTNPRGDLRTVLKEGEKRLNANTSIIIFPQTTRTIDFDPKKFNTLGVKLARRGNVPVIPMALKTDAWGVGGKYKDFGKIRPEKPVHICFGDPIQIMGSGKKEHNQIIDFITSKLNSWKNGKTE